MVTVYNPDKVTPENYCHPAVARQLLRDEKADVICQTPFKIALRTEDALTNFLSKQSASDTTP